MKPEESESLSSGHKYSEEGREGKGTGELAVQIIGSHHRRASEKIIIIKKELRDEKVCLIDPRIIVMR